MLQYTVLAIYSPHPPAPSSSIFRGIRGVIFSKLIQNISNIFKRSCSGTHVQEYLSYAFGSLHQFSPVLVYVFTETI